MRSRRSTRYQHPHAWVTRRWRLALLLSLLLLPLGGYYLLRSELLTPQPSEPPYTPSGEIEWVTLTAGEDFTRERTLAWRCGQSIRPATLLLSRISERGDTLRPQHFTPHSEILATAGGRAVYYHCPLDSLQPGATYTYTLQVSGARDYRGHFSLPDSTPSTSFFYLGDLRGSSPQDLRQLWTQLRQSQLPADFLAQSGGIIDEPTETAWQRWYSALGSYPAQLPLLLSPGTGESQQAWLSSSLDPRWSHLLVYPQNGPQSYLGRSYFIDFPLLRFIVLDTTDLLSLGSIRQQRAWLQEVIAGSHQPWRIVLMHHAVDRAEEGKKNLVMHYLLKDELLRSGVDLILQGHDHSYARTTHRSAQGDTMPPLLVTSSASPQFTRNGFPSDYDRLASGLRLYQHITIEPERLSYVAYRLPQDSTEGLAACRYDSLLLTRATSGAVHIQDLSRSERERFAFDSFADDARGRKRATQYAREVRERAKRHASAK